MKLPKKMRHNKKGIAGINFMISLAIGIFILVMLFYVLAVAGANMRASTTDANAQALIDNYTAAIGSQGSNISLWLTLGGMVVLVGIVVIIIVMMRRAQVGTMGGGGAL